MNSSTELCDPTTPRRPDTSCPSTESTSSYLPTPKSPTSSSSRASATILHSVYTTWHYIRSSSTSVLEDTQLARSRIVFAESISTAIYPEIRLIGTRYPASSRPPHSLSYLLLWPHRGLLLSLQNLSTPVKQQRRRPTATHPPTPLLPARVPVLPI
jgi:hypothetical protein